MQSFPVWPSVSSNKMGRFLYSDLKVAGIGPLMHQLLWILRERLEIWNIVRYPTKMATMLRL